MASSKQDSSHQPWAPGRGFTSADPERQREVIGYVPRAAVEATAPRSLPRRDWMQALPERDGSNFEGSSSRRSR